MQAQVRAKAIELLQSGTCDRILGWKTGEFFYDVTPAVFTTVEEIEKDLVYNAFCGANFSKYLIAESRKGGKIGAFLKPCDTYSFQQLLKEHRIWRENTYIVGLSCPGMCDMDKIREAGIKGVTGGDFTGETLSFETLYGQQEIAREAVLAERCKFCKSKKLVIFDELLGEQGEEQEVGRFDEVERLEAMTAEERFAFWQQELSKCIRCNACRNVCPACSCRKCVFDSNKFDSAQKANVDSFEEKMFHIIRAFHVAGRCTDCGECSRVCPQGIPLHLFNRKFIKDINELYGEYQAGADLEPRTPLTNYEFEDVEPGIVAERG